MNSSSICLPPPGRLEETFAGDQDANTSPIEHIQHPISYLIGFGVAVVGLCLLTWQMLTAVPVMAEAKPAGVASEKAQTRKGPTTVQNTAGKPADRNDTPANGPSPGRSSKSETETEKEKAEDKYEATQSPK